ncbi:MAG: hypothetical protein CMH32_00820 [Micavibrio sp.]|nr:hypothetical protein [Micavibrio sp.]HCK33172.1 hypothetical protein [Rhodospirillaceae bacterium]|tara:strand:+ start:523 stop:921 length:399 start_codon:yes stop_codon:yes gene_type:complete
MTRDKIDFNERLLEISNLANQLKKKSNPAREHVRQVLNIAVFMRLVDVDKMLESGLVRPTYPSGVKRSKSGDVNINSVLPRNHRSLMSHVVKRTRAIRHLFNNPKQQTDHELVKNGTYDAVIERARHLNMDV